MLYMKSKKHDNTEYTVNGHFLPLKAETTVVFIKLEINNRKTGRKQQQYTFK